MENKKVIPNNSVYTAIYKNGKVNNEYLPLLDIKLNKTLKLSDKLLEYEKAINELVVTNNQLHRELTALTETVNQLISTTAESFSDVMDEMKKNEFL